MSPGKKCSTCGLVVPLTEFNKQAAATDGLQSRCRACCRVWYEMNRVAHMANVHRRNVAHRAQIARLLGDFLRLHPCVDCGERDIRCLEFDHRDRSSKTAEISRMARNATPWKVILCEIEKCDVRCANCHRRKTAAEDNSWRHRFYMADATVEHLAGLADPAELADPA